MFSELVDMHVARGEVAPCACDADLWFFKIFVFKTGCAEHGAAGSAIDTLDDGGRIFSERAFFVRRVHDDSTASRFPVCPVKKDVDPAVRKTESGRCSAVVLKNDKNYLFAIGDSVSNQIHLMDRKESWRLI